MGAALPSCALAVFRDSLQRLQDKLYYLNVENDKFWFNVRPNLRREMEDRKARYGIEQALPFMKDRLRHTLKQGMFSAVHIFASSSDIPDDEQLRLVVLPPREAYSKTLDNNALSAALNILENRGDIPRQNRNRLLFLAPEHDNIARLVDQIKSFLAWQAILSDSAEDKLVLDTLQIKNARTATEKAKQIAARSVEEAFKWLLVPYCDEKNLTETVWEKLPLSSGTANFISEIERQLRENEMVIERWASVHLKHALEQWFWKNDVPYRKAMDVWQATCRYLYLPRLGSKGVFTRTITDGLTSHDFFAIAQGMEEERFLGFSFGKASILILDASTLLISPEKAKEYEAALMAADAQKSPSLTQPEQKGNGSTPKSGTTGSAGSSETTDLGKVFRRFIGSVNIDPMMGKMDSQVIFDEVIQHLYEYTETNVKITLEIEAITDNPSGFDSSIQRTIKENSTHLNFTIAEFSRNDALQGNVINNTRRMIILVKT